MNVMIVPMLSGFGCPPYRSREAQDVCRSVVVNPGFSATIAMLCCVAQARAHSYSDRAAALVSRYVALGTSSSHGLPPRAGERRGMLRTPK